MATCTGERKRTMTVELKNRNGVYYAMGTLILPSGVSVEIRKTTGFTVKQRQFAEQRLAEIIKKHIESDGKAVAGASVTVAKAVRMFMAAEPRSKADRCYLESFEREFGAVEMGALDKIKVRQWAEKGSVKPNTIRRRVGVLNSCLNYTRDYGFSVAELKLKKPAEGEARDRWLTPEERDKFLAAMDHELYRDIATFLFYTGARLGEALSRKVEHVLPDGILLESRKGVRRRVLRRVVPLHDGLKAMIEGRIKHLKAGDLIFQSSRGQMVDDATFRHYWFKVCKAQGIEDFKPHDARHTFATLLAKTGEVDLQELAQLLGHANIQMTMRYRHLLPRRQVIGVNNLGVIRTQLAQDDGAVRDDGDGASNFLSLTGAWSPCGDVAMQ